MTRAARFLPYLLGVMAIWLVSSMSHPPIPEPLLFWNSDKIMHATAYGALSLLALYGARDTRIAFAMTSLYGVVDELHQHFVPGRTTDVFDWAADSTGALVALALVVFGRSLRRQVRE